MQAKAVRASSKLFGFVADVAMEPLALSLGPLGGQPAGFTSASRKFRV
jgi:hypothetical protein